MRSSDWSSDVCSSDLVLVTSLRRRGHRGELRGYVGHVDAGLVGSLGQRAGAMAAVVDAGGFEHAGPTGSLGHELTERARGIDGGLVDGRHGRLLCGVALTVSTPRNRPVGPLVPIEPDRPQDLWALRHAWRAQTGTDPGTADGWNVTERAARLTPVQPLTVHGPGRGHPALVAQGIEHRFPKPCVAGSNPEIGRAHV